MSLLDQVRKLEHEVVDRLKALEPLIFEYDQLRKVAERLGVKYTPTAAEAAGEGEPATPQGTRRPGRARAAAKGTAKPRAKRSTTARRSTAATATGGTARAAGSRAKRSAARTGAGAGPGRRREQVLAVVGEHPGITVREIGERLGVDATGLYRVVKQLTDEGRLRKDGPRLHPAEPSAATAPALESGASAPAAGASDGQPTESPATNPEPITPPDA
jgi:Winged helix-turn-helix DNA-binding